MTRLRITVARVIALFRRGSLDATLDDEVATHLELLTAENLRRGLSPESAREAARREFGGEQQVREAYRDQRGFTWLDDLARDGRHAARSLVRTPGFTVVAVLTLALGIGANTAIFSVVHAVLLRPLSYDGSDRLVRLMMTVAAPDSPTGAPQRVTVTMSAAELGDVRSRTRTLSHVGTIGVLIRNLSGQEPRLLGSMVSATVFQMVGAHPRLGRVFSAADEAPGADAVILLSHAAWQRYFAGDPGIVGQRVFLERVPGPAGRIAHTVVGVMPETFELPARQTRFWIPFQPTVATGALTTRGSFVARLADGVSLETAAAEIGPIVRQVRDGQRGNANARYELASQRAELVASVRPALLVLMVAVGFVLLIACVNVANLLLARTAARQREIAVRAALGAGRGRLVRLFLTESLMLSLLGGVGGVLLAIGGVRLLRTLGTTLSRIDFRAQLTFPRLDEVGIDGSVLMCAIATSLVTGVLFGLVPALRYSRRDPVVALKESNASSVSRFRLVRAAGLRGVLVVAQISLATVLLVGGGLLMRSFINLTSVDPGYDPSNVLTFQVALPPDRYPDARLKTFSDDLVARLPSIAGVQVAGYARQLPMVSLQDSYPLRTTPGPPTQPPRLPLPDTRLVSRDYLRAMGMRVVAGRGFGESDGPGKPRVLLINEAMARRDFADVNPVGRTVYVGPDSVPWEIVGIVGDVRQLGLEREPEPQVIADLRQWPVISPRGPFPLFPAGVYYALRTSIDPMSVVDDVRAMAKTSEEQATLFYVAPMEHLVAATISRPRMYAVLLGIFAAVGVLLAAIGIYGVMAYSVTQRTREIGIRMALGARRTSVWALVLRHSVILMATGLMLGLAGAAALTRYLQGMLFGITPLDQATFVAVTVLFATVAAVAAFVPARRATTIDPLAALRCE